LEKVIFPLQMDSLLLNSELCHQRVNNEA